MAKKRGNGEGCIVKEKSGRYRIVISVMVNGSLERKQRTAWKYADATAILDEMRADAGVGIDLRNITLRQHMEEWLSKIVTKKLKRAPNTIESYRIAIETHIVPHIGLTQVRRLTAAKIEKWISDLTESGTGSRAIENAYKILRSGIKWAKVVDRIAKDPMVEIAKPEHEAEEIFPFTIEESRKILSETVGNRWHVAYHLGLTAGMRGGEILGLEFSKINFEDSTALVDNQAVEIRVKQRTDDNDGSGETSSYERSLQKPKTKSSLRTVHLTPETMEAIRQQREILRREGIDKPRLVCPSRTGGIASRSNFRQRVWLPLLSKLGIDPRGFHHARHTYATTALGSGLDIAVVSKQLGHSKISITYDLYHHVMKDRRTHAVEEISRIFSGKDSSQ